jgi:hypothetical protein
LQRKTPDMPNILKSYTAVVLKELKLEYDGNGLGETCPNARERRKEREWRGAREGKSDNGETTS